MTSLHLVPVATHALLSRPAGRADAAVSAIADALRAEERLLGELVAIVRRQREAISNDDLDALDDSVFATHRLLLTLGEARRRRRALNELIGEGDDLSLDALGATFDHAPPPSVSDAMTSLAAVATTLHREVDMNRRVLRHAIDSGDQMVRVLSAVPDDPASYEGRPAAGNGGAFFDRRI